MAVRGEAWGVQVAASEVRLWQGLEQRVRGEEVGRWAGLWDSAVSSRL